MILLFPLNIINLLNHINLIFQLFILENIFYLLVKKNLNFFYYNDMVKNIIYSFNNSLIMNH